MTRKSDKRGTRRLDVPPDMRRRQGRRKRSAFGSVLFWGATLGIWALVAAAGLVAYYARDLPDISGLASPTRQPSITVLAADGSTLATIGNQYGQYVDVKSLPPHLPQAVVAVEDRRFYRHFGIDPVGLLRAAVANLRAGAVVQGGSTITQQLAKNLFLSPDRTLKRKIQESLLALWLERRFTKDQILTIYLNRVYLGAGAYGVDAAARRYFGKPAREVGLYEAAVLAGLLKAPSRFSPTRAASLTAQRARHVLRQMAESGFIAPAEAKRAGEGSALFVRRDEPDADLRYFTDWVVDQVDGFTGGIDRDLVVRTTLDPELQRLAETKVKEALEGPGREAGAAEAAMVVLTPDGAVRAMVGGRDYGTSQFNRATQALRQPGSAFKLFVYLAAIESGMRPSDLVLDAPIAIRDWSPGNFDDKYKGEITLTQALAESRNTAAVRIAHRVGVERVIEVAKRLGITSPLRPDLSLALGTSEVTLLELASAYGALANAGNGVWAYGITEIRDWQGRVLYRRKGSGPGRVVTASAVATMAEMLSHVLTEGTGRAAALERPAAGKTGTSQGFRDAWFIGYTNGLVAGVWFGNDNQAPMEKVTGGRLPAKVWHDFMAEALKDAPALPLPGLESGMPMAEAPATRPVEGLPWLSQARREASRPGAGFWDQVLQNIGIGR